MKFSTAHFVLASLATLSSVTAGGWSLPLADGTEICPEVKDWKVPGDGEFVSVVMTDCDRGAQNQNWRPVKYTQKIKVNLDGYFYTSDAEDHGYCLDTGTDNPLPGTMVRVKKCQTGALGQKFKPSLGVKGKIHIVADEGLCISAPGKGLDLIVQKCEWNGGLEEYARQGFSVATPDAI